MNIYKQLQNAIYLRPHKTRWTPNLTKIAKLGVGWMLKLGATIKLHV